MECLGETWFLACLVLDERVVRAPVWAEPEFSSTVVVWEVTALHALLPLAMNPRGGRLLAIAKLGFTCQMPTFCWVMLGYIPLNPTLRRQRQETTESLKPSYL